MIGRRSQNGALVPHAKGYLLYLLMMGAGYRWKSVLDAWPNVSLEATAMVSHGPAIISIFEDSHSLQEWSYIQLLWESVQVWLCTRESVGMNCPRRHVLLIVLLSLRTVIAFRSGAIYSLCGRVYRCGYVQGKVLE